VFHILPHSAPRAFARSGSESEERPPLGATQLVRDARGGRSNASRWCGQTGQNTVHVRANCEAALYAVCPEVGREERKPAGRRDGGDEINGAD